GHQTLGCRHTPRTADFEQFHQRTAARCPLEFRWRRDSRGSSVASLARAVLGGNRRRRGKGESGDRAAMNQTREELLFQLALSKPAANAAQGADSLNAA